MAGATIVYLHNTGEYFSSISKIADELNMVPQVLSGHLTGRKPVRYLDGLHFVVCPEKTCSVCGVILTNNNRTKSAIKRKQRFCKICYNKKQKEHKQNKKIPGCKYSKNLLEDLWNKQGGKCHICKINLNKCIPQIDHIIPVSKGGTNGHNNLQILCRQCNYGKYDGTDKKYIEHCKLVAKNND